MLPSLRRVSRWPPLGTLRSTLSHLRKSGDTFASVWNSVWNCPKRAQDAPHSRRIAPEGMRRALGSELGSPPHARPVRVPFCAARSHVGIARAGQVHHKLPGRENINQFGGENA